MNTSQDIIESTLMLEKKETILSGACPFLALRQLSLDEKVKFSAVARALFNNTKSANKAFWVFCHEEEQRLASGKLGYTLSHERMERLKSIGISCEVIFENGGYKTVAYVDNRMLFDRSVQQAKKRKGKQE